VTRRKRDLDDDATYTTAMPLPEGCEWDMDDSSTEEDMTEEEREWWNS